MGDTPIQPGTPAEFPQQDAPAGALSMSSAAVPDPASPYLQQQHGRTPQDAFTSQLDMAQAHGAPRGGVFDMNAMANSMPQAPYRPGPFAQGQHRYNAIAVPSPVSPFATQAAMTPVPGQQYYLPPHGHVAHFYPTPLSPQPQAGMPSRPDLGYYQNAVANHTPHPASQYYYPQPTHFGGQASQIANQMMGGQYATLVPPHVDQRQPQPQMPGGAIGVAGSVSPVGASKGATEGRRSIVRGPPRKPRQSGHAIWIGNLPPQTELMALVHHVCKEAEGLESLFLISKSNCAFANFRDEEASVAAQRKLHDSKFLTVRLVSRLRKSTVEGPSGTAPTGPAAAAAGGQADSAAEPAGAVVEGGEGEGSTTDSATAPAPTRPRSDSSSGGVPAEGAAPQRDRFFILKSLTVEDIELSVKTNIWATQSHNEEVLNKAFKNSDNVYLIFSANKSGEYFGYARMVSPINNDPEAAIEFAPKAQSASDVELPKAIPTEATEFAPKGRIIDDSARGTIFWEAERDDTASGSTAGHGTGDDEGSPSGSVSGDTGSAKSGHEGATAESKAWGKPFRLEWLSTARLPFYRTRGLRNAWNSNREVKIARDGTEIEPTVGRKLIGLFNRTQSPALAVPGLLPAGVVAAGGGRGPVPLAPYQPTR